MDFILYKGVTFELGLSLTTDTGEPLDLTGYTVYMQCRYLGYSGELAFDVSVENGRLEIVNNVLHIEVSADDTKNLKEMPCVFDVQLKGVDGKILKVFEGKIDVKGVVTKWV